MLLYVKMLPGGGGDPPDDPPETPREDPLENPPEDPPGDPPEDPPDPQAQNEKNETPYPPQTPG